MTISLQSHRIRVETLVLALCLYLANPICKVVWQCLPHEVDMKIEQYSHVKSLAQRLASDRQSVNERRLLYPLLRKVAKQLDGKDGCGDHY